MSPATPLRSPLDLKHELEIATKLVNLGYSVTVGTHDFGGKGWTQRLKVSLPLIDKAMITFQAIRLLVRNSYPDDAAALLRSFVEVTVNAAYIFHKGDTAADDFIDYLDVRKWIDVRDLKNIWPAYTRGIHPPRELRAMKAQFDKLRPRFKERLSDWTNMSLLKRAEFLDHRYDAAFRTQFSKTRFKTIWGKEFIGYRLSCVASVAIR